MQRPWGAIPFAGDAAMIAKFVQWTKKFGSWGEKAYEFLRKLFSKVPDACPFNSFPAGTRVLMADGSTVPIEKVRTGDTVLATDPETGETGPRRVDATIHTPDDRDFTDFTVAGSDGKSATLTATDHHLIWSAGTHKWTEAVDLDSGDTLRTPSGSTVEVSSVRHWKTLQSAFNLTVNDLHTYYVLAGGTPVLVHNDSKPFKLCGPDAKALSDWDKATFESVEESAEYHLKEHGKGRTFAELTQEAKKLWDKTRPEDREEWPLKDGTKGWKIRGGLLDGQGIYTKAGKIVTWWD